MPSKLRASVPAPRTIVDMLSNARRNLQFFPRHSSTAHVHSDNLSVQWRITMTQCAFLGSRQVTLKETVPWPRRLPRRRRRLRKRSPRRRRLPRSSHPHRPKRHAASRRGPAKPGVTGSFVFKEFDHGEEDCQEEGREKEGQEEDLQEVRRSGRGTPRPRTSPPGEPSTRALPSFMPAGLSGPLAKSN